MYHKIEVITPERAETMLKTMGENRALSWNRLVKYADEMKRGQWTISPQPVCFDENGRLIDGQHRLSAVVRSGATVVMDVAYDVPHDCILDKGMERSTGDALYMRGLISRELNKKAIISIVNTWYRIALGVDASTIISDTEKSKFIAKNEENILKASHICATGKKDAIGKRAPIATAIFAALKKGVSEATLIEFARVLNTGFSGGDHQSAAIVLRNFALQNKGSTGRVLTNELAIIAEKAIYDFAHSIPRRKAYKPDAHVYIDVE